MPPPVQPKKPPLATKPPAIGRYWKANLRLMGILLTVWALAGLGAGVLFADYLDQLGSIGGFPLGFWFAQQGSIIIFILLILVYAIAMNRLDAKHHQELAEQSRESSR
jgi:putative solute:sodium symporter small subunit